MHTPGPWGAAATPTSSLNDIRHITGPYGEDIATVHCSAGDMDQQESLANARLIKSAPKMLAALQMIETDKDGDGFICREAMELVRHAISQAEGREACSSH